MIQHYKLNGILKNETRGGQLTLYSKLMIQNFELFRKFK